MKFLKSIKTILLGSLLIFNIDLKSETVYSDNYIPAQYFACASNPVSFQLSPDGVHLLITNTVKDNVCDIEQDKAKQIEDEYRSRGLLLLNLETMQTTMLSDGSDSNRISAAGWLNNDRIWFRPQYKAGQSVKGYGVTYAMDLDGKRRTTIKEGGFAIQRVYDMAYDEPNTIYVISNERRDAVFDFYKLNIYTGAKKRIALGPDIGDMKGKAIQGYLAGTDKQPLGMLIDDGIKRILYMYDKDSKEWYEHFTFNCQEPGFTPIGTYNGKIVVSGSKFSPNGELIEYNDTNAIYFYDHTTKTFSEKLYQDERYDVGGLTGSCRPASGSRYSIGASGEISSISYESYQPEYLFFDKQLEQTYVSIASLFPNDFVRAVTSGDGGNKLVVSVSSSNNPGEYYFVDLKQGQVTPLHTRNPWLDREKLAKTIPVSYTARDGLEIPAYLTLTKEKTDKKMLIIMPHGGPNTKQRIGYDSWAQFLVNRGYNVLQPDFRGSTGLGANHYKAGNVQWGKKMQDDLTDGVNWAIQNGYADPDRVCIAGASYGGYATMAGLTFTPDVYRCGINAIGVTDQEQLLQDYARRASKFQSWDEEPLLEWGDMSTPEGREYAKEISPILHVKNIKAPLLILHGSNDYVVPPFHARNLIDELKKYGKTYEAMFQAYEGHCVTYCGELASQEYMEIQEKFLEKYLRN